MAQAHEVFVINLDRRPDRLKFMADQLDAMDLRWERIPALDAKTATDADFPDMALGNMFRPYGPAVFCLTQTVINIFRRIVETGSNGAVILQDDAMLSRDLETVAQRQDWVPEAFGLVQMEFWPGRRNMRLLGEGHPTRIEGRQVHRLHSRSLGGACYFVRRWGAEAFLRHTLPARAIDDQILFNPALARAFDRMHTGLLVPALAKQRPEEFVSDISQPGTYAPGLWKLKKELNQLRPSVQQLFLTVAGKASWQKVGVRL